MSTNTPTSKPRSLLRLVQARSNYADFLHADYGHNFHVWLGVDNPPVYERCEWGEHRGKFRMLRKWWHPEFETIAGDWCTSRKEAKASYKAALKARRPRRLNAEALPEAGRNNL